MNEEPSPVTHDRPAWTARFFARLQRYRNLLAQRWWVLFLCAGLALGGEAVYLWLSPPEYASVGQMIVNVRLNIQQSSLYTEELGNFIGTQAALMQGGEVLDHARDRVAGQNLGLTPQPVLLNVSVLPKTTIFLLRATGQNPKYTQAFLQACMEEYINLKKELAEHTSSTTIAALTDQMQRLEPSIQNIDDRIIAFMSTNDAALLQEASGVENYLSLLYQQLAEANSEYALLQSMTLDQNLLLEQSRNAGNGRGQSGSESGNCRRFAGQRRPGQPIRTVCPQHHRHDVSDDQTTNPAAAGGAETVWRIPETRASGHGRLGPGD